MAPEQIDPTDAAASADSTSTDVPKRKKRRKEPRWPIRSEYREAAMRRLALMAIDRNETPTAVCNAVKLLLAAEAQNQTDEHRRANRSSGKVVVAEDPNWYFNDAHTVSAQGNATSNADAAVAGAEEGHRLRPQVGQDSPGTNGVAPRPWPTPEPPPGSD
jgi:hypothetical protein